MKQFELVYFLSRFYGINNNMLNSKKLTHKDVLTLFPDIRTCPLRKVNNEDIYKGNILMVYDKNNKIAYYYNPHLDINYDFEMSEDEDIKINFDNIEILSKEELLKLRRKARLLSLREKAKALTKLIREKKKIEPKEYRKKKKKLKIKESYYD